MEIHTYHQFSRTPLKAFKISILFKWGGARGATQCFLHDLIVLRKVRFNNVSLFAREMITDPLTSLEVKIGKFDSRYGQR